VSSVSVITPVFGRSDLTARWLYQNWTIFSDRPNIEWIVINNGSPDNTAQLLGQWQKMMGDSLKVITLADNIGFGPANNRGAEIATGRILAFISNDVEVLGDYITPLKIVGSYDQGDKIWGPELWENNTGWNTFTQGTIPYVAGWCVIVQAASWGQLCKWDERFVPCDYEDIDLSFQVTNNGGGIAKLPLPLRHESGKTANAMPGGRLRVTLANRERFMEKWALEAVK